MDFLTQLFSSLPVRDSLLVCLFLLGAFLIGLITGWLYWRRIWKRVQGELDATLRELNDLKAKYASLQEQFELKEADLKKANLEIEELTARIRQLQEEKGNLHSEIIMLKKQLGECGDARTALLEKEKSYLSRLEDFDNQMLGLKTKNQQLSAQITSAPNTGDLDGLKAKIGELEGANADLNAKLGDMDGLNAKIGNLEAENADLKAKLEAAAAAPVVMAAASAEPKEELSKEELAAKAEAEVKAAFGGKLSAASADDKDDLKLINGVGPFIEKKLNNLGIYTFEQVSQFDEDLANKVTDAIQFFPGRIQRDDWRGQAQKLMGMKTSGTLGALTDKKVPTNVNDLKIVEGIGPKIEGLLKAGGVNTWAELAAAPVSRLQEILNQAGDRYRIHNPESWPQQAKLADEGKWDELEKLQDYLDGGKDPSKK